MIIKKEQKKRIMFYLTPSVVNKLKNKSKELNRSTSYVLEEIIKQFIGE